MLTLLISLIATLGVLLATLGLVRRLQSAGRNAGQSEISVLSRTGVGPKQGVALIRAGTRVFLISLGDGGVRLLAEIEGDEAKRLIESVAAPASLPLLFEKVSTRLRDGVKHRGARSGANDFRSVLSEAGQEAPSGGAR